MEERVKKKEICILHNASSFFLYREEEWKRSVSQLNDALSERSG